MANIITRAPKWAWYTAAGVGIAGGAFQVMRHRQAAQVGTADGGVADGSGGAGSPVGLAPSPAPGIVVPPVIIPGQQNDPLAGVQPLQDLYLGAVSGLVQDYKDLSQGWSNVYQPILTQLGGQNQSLISLVGSAFLNTNDAMLAIAQAGAPPASSPVNSPIVGNPAVAAPAVTPAKCPPSFPEGTPGNCFRTSVHRDCHCEGTGRNRKCWTRQLHDHVRQSGGTVTVNVTKVKDGC